MIFIDQTLYRVYFYVYAYLRVDGTPYYIGKGKGNRAYEQHRINGKGIQTPTDNARIIFLETNLTELGAFAIERRMIRWYGRKDIGTGILRNKTDGGEGFAGLVKTDEHRKKIGLANKGRILGSHTKDTNEKRRKTMMGKNKRKKLLPLFIKNHKESISGKNKYIKTEIHKKRLSDSHIGLKQTNETKLKRKKTWANRNAEILKPLITPLGFFLDVRIALAFHKISRGTLNNRISKCPENYFWIK